MDGSTMPSLPESQQLSELQEIWLANFLSTAYLPDNLWAAMLENSESAARNWAIKPNGPIRTHAFRRRH